MQSDEELLAEIARIKPIAKDIVGAMPDGVLAISDPLIIRAACGPRRISSRSRGLDLNAYPNEVSAGKGLWLDWISTPKTSVQIVIAKKLAQARIDAALKNSGIFRDPETVEREPASEITDEEVSDMMDERAELRRERRFAEADMIRDYLVRHGVDVSDKSLKTM